MIKSDNFNSDVLRSIRKASVLSSCHRCKCHRISVPLTAAYATQVLKEQAPLPYKRNRIISFSPLLKRGKQLTQELQKSEANLRHPNTFPPLPSQTVFILLSDHLALIRHPCCSILYQLLVNSLLFGTGNNFSITGVAVAAPVITDGITVMLCFVK